jgi:hypothetical protein
MNKGSPNPVGGSPNSVDGSPTLVDGSPNPVSLSPALGGCMQRQYGNRPPFPLS